MAEGSWDKWHPNQKATERNQKGDYYGLNVCVPFIHMLKANNKWYYVMKWGLWG